MKDTISQIADYKNAIDFAQQSYLSKNSGKLKTLAKKAAEALNITWCCLPKLNGRRFVGHHHRALKKLLHNWPALLTAFTDFLLNLIIKGSLCESHRNFKQIEVLSFFMYNGSISRYSFCHYLWLLKTICQ